MNALVRRLPYCLGRPSFMKFETLFFSAISLFLSEKSSNLVIFIFIWIETKYFFKRDKIENKNIFRSLLIRKCFFLHRPSHYIINVFICFLGYASEISVRTRNCHENSSLFLDYFVTVFENLLICTQIFILLSRINIVIRKEHPHTSHPRRGLIKDKKTALMNLF